MAKKSKLEAAREAMGLSVRRVAEELELDISGYSRIEKGASLPKRETAAVIYDFFLAEIPLGMIYDPLHRSYDGWLSAEQKRRLQTLGKTLARKHPGLGAGDLRKARA
jgi:transcriptional regulator with XRE-family HTH domain